MNNKSILILASLLSFSISAQTLFSDNFQDGNFDGWTITGAGAPAITNQYGSNYSLRLVKQKQAMQTIQTDGYSNLEISVDMAGYLLEYGERCIAKYSTDNGNNWNLFATLVDGQDDGVTLYNASATLATSTTEVILSLATEGSDNADYCYFDNISVNGEPVAVGDDNGFEPLTGSGNVSRSQLTASTLNSNNASLINNSAYALPTNAAHPSNTFSGTLTLSGESTKGILQEQGTNIASSYTNPEHLPEFEFEFVQTGSHIIPLERGLIATTHPDWHYILEPGRVWNENNDNGFSRVALPFALQEAGANCTHNGVLSFLFKDDGSVSNVAYQISAETCVYFKFNSWGMLGASYTSSTIADSDTIKSSYIDEVTRRMPTKNISELATDYPSANINIAQLGSDQSTSDQTVFGVVVDGTNYVSSCKTRMGNYPFCEVMALPSYSTAKSVVGAVGLMRMEQKYPGTKTQSVNQCYDSSWSQVNFENLLDMATGRYNSDSFEVDEGDSTTANNFFLKYTNSEKLNHACSYTKKATAGTKWVYHTSDTYLIGVQLNALESTDLWDMLYTDVWQPLGVSPLMSTTSRTTESTSNPWSGQPLTGYGLSYHYDDVVKIAEFLNQDQGIINGVQILEPTILAQTLQTQAHGLNAGSQYDSYDNGFWIWNAQQAFSCANALSVPYMSGYGGIVVSLLPNDMIYYAFSDSNDYGQVNTALELNKIRNMCN